MSDRIQKVLAQQGFGSRRTIETWIKEGRIQVAGRVATLGQSLKPGQKVRIDGKAIELKTIEHQHLLYHKPIGEECSYQPDDDRDSVFDSLPKLEQGKWISIGRLDVSTSGLLLLTTDGELANQWMHPSSNLERRYVVRAYGRLDESVLNGLKKGVTLEDGFAKFKHVRHRSTRGHNHWFEVTLLEGRNRLVRRLFEAFDLKVNRLSRVQFGHIPLPVSLKPGQCQTLPLAKMRLQRT